MRYIDLRKERKKSAVNAVLKLGCGPNFVRNRSEAFEKMIKEQGVEFWFRFWLSFCFQHGIKEFNDVEEELPEWNLTLLKNLHNKFVQVSGDRAIDYCWNVIFENGPPMRRVLDEIYQFLAMEFASTLGEVFFKWLVAEEMNGSGKEYWTIPLVYLDPEFRPGSMEKFLVRQWGKKLTELLGVTRDDVPWIRPLLSQKEAAEDYDYSSEFVDKANVLRKQFKDTWTLKLKGMRKAIESADELRKLHQNRAGTKIVKICNEGKKKQISPQRSSLKQPQCSCCGSFTHVKKCQVCVDENWPIPKYYCGISCQSKDWYEKHKKEHYKYMKRRKRVLSRVASAKLVQNSEKSVSSIEI